MPSAPRHPRYEVLDPLGRGGAAFVWRARDRQEGREVALKVLRSPDADSRARFRREIELLSSIAHDGVVRLLDVGRCGEELFYTMELQAAPRLDEIIAQPPPSPRERVRGAVRLVSALFEVLAWLHDRGIVHGDLKPANVFVMSGETGDGHTGSSSAEDAAALWHAPWPRVRLVDFGVARVVSTRPLDLVAGEGTPLYMAPEQLRGEELGPASDLWSAGIVLYHLLAGRPPRSTLAEIVAAREPPPYPRLPGSSGNGEELPPALAALFARLLEPRPSRRLASAAEARALLDGALSRTEPRPRVEPRLSEPVFTGRETEIAELEAALEIAASGRSVVARVQGFAAEGKSWLFRRGPFVVRALVAWDALLLHASLGTPERAEASFESLKQSLLAHLIAPSKKDAGKPSSSESELPSPADESAAIAAAESGPESAAEEALPLLRALADRMLVVLVVEDPSSDADVLWLRRVEQILHDRAALLAISYRPELLAASRPLAAWFRELDEKGEPPVIQLGELGDRDLARYLEGVLVPHRTPSPRLLAALSAGDRIQPAAVHRRLHDLVKRGEIRESESGEWDLEETASIETAGTGAGSAPSRRPSAPSAPLATTLDEPARRVLLASFVLGDTADAELIEELASHRDEGDRELAAHDRRKARSSIRDLLIAGLITNGPEGLSAAPSRELKQIVAETPPDEIRRLHGRAASILLDRAGASATPSRWSARIARHLEEAGRLDRAAAMWLEAGHVALASSRNHVALARFERALALATSSELRFESALALGDLRARLGDAAAALSAYEVAEETSHLPELDVELDDRIGRVLQKLRRVDEADVRFRRTFDRAGEDPLRRGRALLRLAGIAFDQHEPVEARRLYDEALSLVELAGAVDLELAVLSGLGLLDKQDGDLERAAARFERALECAERLSRPLETAAVLNNLGTIWRMRGRADEAVRCLERSIDLRERAGDRRGLAICLTNLARIHRARGELAQAEESTARALAIFIEVGDGKGVLIARHNIAEIALARSRLDVTLEQIRRLEEDARGEHAGPILASAGVLRAKAHALRAGAAEGLEMLDRTLAELGEGDAGARTRALALRSELLGSLGHDDEARRSLDKASSGAEPIDDETRFELDLARLRNHIRQGELEAASDLGRALLSNVPPSAERLARALVHRELGTVYRDLGPDHADRTERHLERAIEDFEFMGCPHEVADALRRYAQYFRLLGEDRLARDCEDRADAAMARAEGGSAIVELSRKERSA